MAADLPAYSGELREPLHLAANYPYEYGLNEIDSF